MTLLFTIKSFVDRSVRTRIRICHHIGLLWQYLFIKPEDLLPDSSGTLLTANCVKSSHSYYVSFRGSLVLLSQLRIQLPRCLFLSCLPVKYMPFSCHSCLQHNNPIIYLCPYPRSFRTTRLWLHLTRKPQIPYPWDYSSVNLRPIINETNLP